MYNQIYNNSLCIKSILLYVCMCISVSVIVILNCVVPVNDCWICGDNMLDIDK